MLGRDASDDIMTLHPHILIREGVGPSALTDPEAGVRMKRIVTAGCD